MAGGGGVVPARFRIASSSVSVIRARPAAGAAARLQHLVDRQPVEPGGEGALPAKAPQPLPGADKHVLGVLLRLSPVPRKPQAQGEYPPHVRLVQRVERSLVPVLGEPDGVVHAIIWGRGIVG